MGKNRQIAYVVFILMLLIHQMFVAVMTHASSAKENQGTLLYANEIYHDDKNSMLTARGNVEIIKDGRILWADVVVYNEKTEMMTASGHVRLDEGSGDIIYLDYAEFTDDFKTGFVDKIRIMLADNSRLVANRGKREDAKISHLEQVVYSPCDLCKTDPTNPPFWQLKAKHAELNENTEDVSYTDAFIEMFGVPILYTPYLRHPAPNVKRRTGLLNVSAGHTAKLGWFSTAEYFWAISDDKDMTLMPLIQTSGHTMMAIEYRQRFEKGNFIFKGSLDPNSPLKKTVDGKTKEVKKTRWHLAPQLKYDFTPHTRGAILIERASDPSYLRRYPQLGYLGESFLTSRIYGEGFWNRSYGIVQGYSFQGLRTEDHDKTAPLLLPWLTINYLGQPDSNGGRLSLDSDAIVLTRQKGTRYGRLSTTGGWQKTYLTSRGEDYTFGAKLRGDIYDICNFHPQQFNNSSVYNTNVARVFPQAYTNWAYPLLRKSEDYRLILEPLVGIVVAPSVPVLKKLPNEDGGAIEFSDANVMNESRFSGLDRIDGGSRLNYGLNIAGFSNKSSNNNIGFFMGQSIAIQKPGQHLAKTGLEKRLSDVVARLKYNYQDWLNLKTRFLLHQHELPKLRFYRNETSASLGRPILNLTTTYIQLPHQASKKIEDTSNRQIMLKLSSVFHENWSANITAVRDLGKKAHTLSQGVSLTYENECFAFSNSVNKNSYRDRQDLKPGFVYMMRINFKTLGEFSQSFNLTRDIPGRNAPGTQVQKF